MVIDPDCAFTLMVPAAFVPIPFSLNVRAGAELAEGVAADGLGEGVEPLPAEPQAAAMRSKVAIAISLLTPEVSAQVCTRALPEKVTGGCRHSTFLKTENPPDKSGPPGWFASGGTHAPGRAAKQ
jgi:hypothetical protein